MNFSSYNLALNLTIFGVSAFFVWIAGGRLAGMVDVLAEKTGIGHGFLGLFLLGGITSLPELATVATASLGGNASLAVNNMIGSIAINILFLAIADFLIGRDALTSVVAHPSTLLQASLTIFLLVLVAAAPLVAFPVLAGASLWSWVFFLVFGFSLWLASQYKKRALGGEKRRATKR